MKYFIAFGISMLSCLHAFAFLQGPASAASATIHIRAASYNIRTGNDSSSEKDINNNWKKRKADLSNLVKDIAPDVIGFQEVQSSQLTYLKTQLPDYKFVGAMRDTSSQSEATPVAFRKDRFELLDSGTFWLSATPEVVGSKVWGGGIADSGYPRICTWVRLADKSSGAVVVFANTHLDLNAGPRLAGMRLILSRLARFAALDVPIVIVGDMNANETEDSIVETEKSMQDSLLVSRTPPTGPWRTLTGFAWKNEEVSCAEALAGYTPKERTANAATLGKRIDYIFSSSNIVVEAFAIRNDARPNMNYYPSDHYPVVANLAVPCMDRLNMHSWISEDAAMERLTGAWTHDVAYGLDGRAYLYNNEFTPYVSSTGNVVIVEATMQLWEDVEGKTPDNTAQTAVRLSTKGCFQVWTHLRQGYGGQAGWVDVEADGVTPVSGKEYTLRFTFDYRNGTCSVEIKTGLSEFIRLVGVESSSSREVLEIQSPTRNSYSNFMIANAANCVSSIAFVGDTFLSSLYGNCKYEVVGFQPGEISVGDATIILDAAKAAWLNKRGDYDAVKSRLANITSKEFRAAWLCNLDIMNETASAELKITSIKVNADNVEITVSLTRTGAISQAINGSLKFYGAETLAQFKSNATKLIASTTLADEDFSQGDTVIRLFPKDDNVFFKAGIEE